MKKRLVLLALSCVVLLALCIIPACKPAAAPTETPTPSPTPTGPVVIKQSIYSPPGHTYTGFAEEFARRVAAATEERVKIEVYPGASLCTAAEELSAAHSGSIDSGMTVLSYIVGQVPLLAFATLPWCAPPKLEDNLASVEALRPLVDKALKDYNVKVIWFALTPDVYCLVTKKPVHTPTDLKGLKIRSAGGGIDDLVVNWGASIVSIPVTEAYSSIQRGIADGTILTIPSVLQLKINEVASHVCDLGIGFNGFIVYFNKDKWNRISSADQKAIMNILPEYLTYTFDSTQKTIEAMRQALPRVGVTVYKPTPTEMQEWKGGAKQIWDKYAQSSPEAKPIVEILKKYGGGI